jgi:HlyD family secretion protein
MKFFSKLKTELSGVWNWFVRKPWRFVLAGVFLLIAVSILGGNKEKFEEIVVEERDLARTVLSSGEVVSTVDLDLSFPKSGVVKEIKVKIGDKVEKGQILATINQGTLNGSVTEALGSLRSAEAKLQEVLEGATSEEIRLAEINLETAQNDLEETKNEQETNILNARRTLYSTDLEAVPEDNEETGIDVYITGTFNSDKAGSYRLEKSPVSPDWKLVGPQTFFGSVSSVTPVPIGNTGLYIRFSVETLPYGVPWIVEIPNTKGASYATNKALYDSAVATASSMISSAESNVKQKEAEYILKKKQARPSEISSAEAVVLQAKGRYLSALAELEDTHLKAPENGTVTAVNIKVGELSEAQNVAMVIENTESLYVESNINEANVDLVYKDAMTDIEFDAFPGKIYRGKISFVEPSETLVSGVVNYKVNADILELDENVRPGLTANLLINIWKMEGATTIPNRAIYERDGKTYVLIKTGKKAHKNEEVEVVRGKIGDGDIAEIERGLKPGDIVLVKIEQ